MGLTLTGKNLLQEEQILSLESKPFPKREANMRMTELLPLKVYSSILGIFYDML